ncbi:hypothetical protein [Ureaplasma ceti]|uniref:ABC transporter substrate-binding protein n=1 Tax=Ureaplasma ceti TaxID=3119530 RepID=A0ABP9U6M9_9BACT
MMKKWMWATPLALTAIAGITGAVVGGYFANVRGNPYREYAASPVGNSNTDLMQMYFAAAVNDTRLMVLPGYLHMVPLTQALAITKTQNAPMYKYLSKSGFILLDDSYGIPVWNGNHLNLNVAQPLWSSQVAAIQFRTDLGAFVTGIAAGEFLNEYQYYFAPQPQDELTFATYGGGPFSSVTSYMGGLQRGIRYFNEYIAPFASTKNGKPYKKIKQLFVGHTEVTNFSNGFGPTQADTLVNNLLAKNVSLLLPVASSQTQQVVRLIKQNHKRTVVLGVDSAAEEDTNSNLELSTPGYELVNGTKKIGGTNRIIQFSSMKKLNVATALMATNIEKGESKPEINSTIGGLGCDSLGTTNNNCVGLSTAGYQYFVRAMEIAEQAHHNNLNNLPAALKYNMTVSGTKVPSEKIQQIFTIPNNNPETNLPASAEYSDYWSPLYQKYLKAIGQTPTFKLLNDPDQKIFYAYNDWEPGQPANNESAFSYADIPNKYRMMMPLNAWGTLKQPLVKPDFQSLDQWFQKDVALANNIANAKTINSERLQSLKHWFMTNKLEIRQRYSFTLKGVLNKEAYEKNKSIMKVFLASPLAPLLDKGFSESAYMGLVDYWKQFGINLPNPDKSSR